MESVVIHTPSAQDLQPIKPSLIKPISTILPNPLHTLRHTLYTIFLFSYDQFIDVLLPCTTFALCTTLSPKLTSNADPSDSLPRHLVAAATWLFVLVLQCDLQNQSSPAGIAEDTLNKSWRPIPAGRITQKQTQRLLDVVQCASALLSYQLGCAPQWVVYTVLCYLYNQRGFGDCSGVSKNGFCAAGYVCFFAGAVRIVAGPGAMLDYRVWRWIGVMTFGALGTTIQIQDLRDEVGDRARGRKTLVIQMGRRNTILWSVGLVVAWSLVLPLWVLRGAWQVSVVPVVLGTVLAIMLLRGLDERNMGADRWVCGLWGLWIMGLCVLPGVQVLTLQG